MNKKTTTFIAILIGITFLAIAIVYWTTPAKSLPVLFPGHDATTKIHFKHGIGALFLGLASFVFAWFQSGKKVKKQESNSKPQESQE